MSEADNFVTDLSAAKYRELNDTAGVRLSASEFRRLCDLATLHAGPSVGDGTPGPARPDEEEKNVETLEAILRDACARQIIRAPHLDYRRLASWLASQGVYAVSYAPDTKPICATCGFSEAEHEAFKPGYYAPRSHGYPCSAFALRAAPLSAPREPSEAHDYAPQDDLTCARCGEGPAVHRLGAVSEMRLRELGEELFRRAWVYGVDILGDPPEDAVRRARDLGVQLVRALRAVPSVPPEPGTKAIP